MYDLGIKLIFRWIYLDFTVASKCRILMQNPGCETVAFSVHRAVAPTAKANGILGRQEMSMVFVQDASPRSQACSSSSHTSVCAHAHSYCSCVCSELVDLRRAPHPHIVLFMLLLVVELCEDGEHAFFSMFLGRKALNHTIGSLGGGEVNDVTATMSQ